MKKNKIWMIFSLGMVVAIYGDENQSSEPHDVSTEPKSTFESVVESIAGAAVSNPDYGKDFSDR